MSQRSDVNAIASRYCWCIHSSSITASPALRGVKGLLELEPWSWSEGGVTPWTSRQFIARTVRGRWRTWTHSKRPTGKKLEPSSLLLCGDGVNRCTTVSAFPPILFLFTRVFPLLFFACIPTRIVIVPLTNGNTTEICFHVQGQISLQFWEWEGGGGGWQCATCSWHKDQM